MDEATVRRALAVSPAGATQPEVRVRGRDVHVNLGDSLRPDITYVLTLGTELRDLRGVATTTPITLAFATGDRIDEGRIGGTVRNGRDGSPAAGLAVHAYRLPAEDAALPDPATAQPDYRTQTSSDGAFELGYLRAGSYFVFAVADRNRDGLTGAEEAFAAPHAPAVAAVDTGAVDRLALFVTTPDSTGPTLRGARAVDPRTVGARFDEPVRLQGDAHSAFVIQDSVSGTAIEVEAAWIAGDSREVLLATQPLSANTYRLAFAGQPAVTDSVGNVAADGSTSFRGTSAATAPARAAFARFLPESRAARDSAVSLLPGERPAVRFSRPVSPVDARSRIAVIDPRGTTIPFVLESDDATTLFVETDAGSYRLQVDDTTNVRRFNVVPADELGSIAGRFVDIGPGMVRVEAILEGGARSLRREVVATDDGSFALRLLPAGSYRLRVHVDVDGDGRWDGGSLAPYAPPEPIGWLEGQVRVRARWESDLGDVRIENGVMIAEGDVDDTQGR